MEYNLMKMNWKVFAALVIVIGVVVWSVSSLLPQSLSGANLTFGVGTGTVTLNNLSDSPVPVQLIGAGSRVFAVMSSTEGIAGSSTRQGSGSTSTQLFEYALPPGKSDFIVTRGSNVKFVSNSDARFEAFVQPLNDSDARSTFILSVVAISAALFYASLSTGHRWIGSLRRKEAPLLSSEVPVEVAVEGDKNRGRDGRMYSNFGNKD
ncbi:MAG: hypothetical protein JNM70_18715 [Anaerolineae bacterium]|nr:hypothetical protein [Anaerolineae bacterium]